jgi:hypothetical protein
MRFKQDIPTYNASVYLHTKSSEREPNKKKIREFMIHAANSVGGIAVEAGNFDVSLRHCLHCIAYCQSNRLLILPERVDVFEWQAPC